MGARVPAHLDLEVISGDDTTDACGSREGRHAVRNALYSGKISGSVRQQGGQAVVQKALSSGESRGSVRQQGGQARGPARTLIGVALGRRGIESYHPACG